ncbi:MAG: RNA methyltransferase [Gemmatimonadota bacterium]
MTLSRRRQALLLRLHRRRTREREGLFLLEGVRASEAALDAPAEIRFALRAPRLDRTAEGRRLSERLDDSGLDLVDVGDDELARVADTRTPQGVVLVCAEPGWALDALAPPGRGRPRLLLLDAIQDPGNAGTLMRTAAGFGLDGVVALDGTVDPWGTKTVRASAGAVCDVRVVRADWVETGAWLSSRGVQLLAAEPDGEDVGALRPEPGWALAVGNEGAGLRGDLRRRADLAVRVPMRGDVESLNAAVAGSILLFALTRPRASAEARASAPGMGP